MSKRMISELFHEFIEDAKKIGAVRYNPKGFYKDLHFSIGSGKVARGGMKRIDGKLRPMVRLSDYVRYHDKELWLMHLRDISRPTKDKVWSKAFEHAHRNEWFHVEYARIIDDPDIGSFVSDDWRDHVKAVIAHELAHAIAYWNKREIKGRDIKPHGSEWRKIYRHLRKELVNPYIGFSEANKIAAGVSE